MSRRRTEDSKHTEQFKRTEMYMSDYLFVYGTLRRGSKHPMARFLAANATYIGSAKTRGRLYDLGAFPGLVDHRNKDDWVVGDLFLLSGAAAVFSTLDDYEGCSADNPQPWLFKRKVAIVEDCKGEELIAWIYFYDQPILENRRFPSGEF